MSQLTTTPLKTAPPAAFQVTVTSAGTIWASGAWVEVLAATSAAAAVAGLLTTQVAAALEFDVGTGAAGAEVVLTTVRVQLAGSGFGGPNVCLLPSPVTGVASGARVAVRLRASAGSTSVTVALLYYESLDATQSSALPTKALPAAANSVTVTPNGTAWANSAYTVLTTGLGAAIAILALTMTQAVANVEGEWDLATGAAGAEVVLTTLRFASASNANAGGMLVLTLPAPYPVAAWTRLAVRLRKSGTATTAYTVALLYDESSAAPPAAVERAESFIWTPV